MNADAHDDNLYITISSDLRTPDRSPDTRDAAFFPLKSH